MEINRPFLGLNIIYNNEIKRLRYMKYFFEHRK